MGRTAALAALALFLLPDGARAQRPSARARAALEARADVWAREAGVDRSTARAAASAGGWATRGVSAGGSEFELVSMRGGRPRYLVTHNASAGRTVRIAPLREGGGLGVDLGGAGVELGIWDAGAVFAGHQELAGRVRRGDDPVQVTNHATHVSGTMAASGVEPEARGVAPLASLVTFDWVNDASEMALAGAAGLTVSNHSYGSFGGWAYNVRGNGRWVWMGDPALGPEEDARFGHYDETAARWDEIAWLAPDYLIVRSAGNERADRGPAPGSPYDLFSDGWKTETRPVPPDGGTSGFDTLLDAGTAKNVLVVGAVDDLESGWSSPSDVEILGMSSYGPTDDGRIKPDLVASGSLLYSPVATGTANYAWSSGTSMASPAVAGVAGLLGELYRDLNVGRSAPSALLRALLIHTADEAGDAPGPDFRHGWGLVNAGRAASLLLSAGPGGVVTGLAGTAGADDTGSIDPGSRSVGVFTGSIDAGSTVEFEWTAEPGGVLRATLAWTDPPGRAGPLVLDGESAALVHDLDLEVLGPDGVFLPWALDPLFPAAPATNGPNHRDNVEQVLAPGVAGGTYTVRISHGMGTTQPFALILGEPPTPGPGRASVSGHVLLRGAPVAGVPVRLSGPTSGMTVTGPDGRFSFDGLGPGAYEVVPDGRGRSITPGSARVELAGVGLYVGFSLEATAWLSAADWFPADRLLGPDGWDTSVRTERPSAGGVYGVRLSFGANRPWEVGGGRVELDIESEPRLGSYAGAIGSRYLDLAEAWPTSTDGSGLVHHWIPALWSAPDLGPGTELAIPVRILDRNGILAGADTLSWIVGGPDDVPPVPFAEIRHYGRAFVSAGTPFIVEIHLLDGCGIASAELVARDRETGRVLRRTSLHDDGDLSRHADRMADDRLFSAYFTPDREAEWMLDVEATDARGNRIVRGGIRYVSSRPFVRSTERLLVSWSESESRTDAHRSVAEWAGFPMDWWEFDTRGPVNGALLAGYRTVFLGRDTFPLDREEERAAIEAALDNGSRILVTGSGAGREADPAWRADVLKAGGAGELERSAYEGDPRSVLSGAAETRWGALSYDLVPGAPIAALRPSPGAEPLLYSGSSVVAYRSHEGGRHVVGLGFSPADVHPPEAAANLLKRLVAELEEDPGLGPVPEAATRPDPPNGTQGVPPGPLTLRWSDEPHAAWDVQIGTDRELSAAATSTRSAQPTLLLDADAPGTEWFWRVRPSTPAGTGPWSATWSFATAGPPEEPNRAPEVSAPIAPLVLRLEDPPARIDGSGVFDDPDEDPLAFSAWTEPPGIAGVEWSGSEIVVTPIAPGETVCSVSATDPSGAAAWTEFPVRIQANRAPILAVDPAVIGLVLGGPARQLAITAYDPDNDPFSLSAAVEPAGVAVASVHGLIVELAAAGAGTARVHITARDSLSAWASVETRVVVRANGPPAFRPLPDPLVTVLGSEPVRLTIADLVEDPDDDPVALEALAVSRRYVETTVSSGDLTISPVAAGHDEVFVTATDPYGKSASTVLRVSVLPARGFDVRSNGIPSVLELLPPYPSPARDHVIVPFDIPRSVHVSLDVVGSDGRLVARLANRVLPAGRLSFEWRTGTVKPGMYWIRLRTDGRSSARPVAIVR